MRIKIALIILLICVGANKKKGEYGNGNEWERNERHKSQT